MKHFLLSLILLSSTAAQAENIFVRMAPPPEQGTLRAEKNISIGIPLSMPYNLPSQLQYRLNETWLIGGGLNMDEDETKAVDYAYKIKTNAASAYVEYYVSGNSGFHIGCGIESRWGLFKEFRMDRGGNKAEETANGSYNALYAGPSFGWTWIWTNGITFGFDLSQRKQFQGAIEAITASGGSTDGTLQRASSKTIPRTVPGTIMIGYSF